jgi:hypothetical protein
MADKKKEEVKHFDYAKLNHKNLDDIIRHIETTHFPEIEHAFKDYDNFTKQQHLDAIKVNILKPSFDSFYSTVEKEIDAMFKKDGNASLHNKEKEVMTVLAKGMLSYIEKARPEMHKVLKENKLVKEFLESGANFKEVYELVSHHLDTNVLGYERGRGQPIYSGLAHQIIGDKEANVNSLKSALEGLRTHTYQNATGHLVNKKTAATIGRFEPIKIATYLRKKVINVDNSGYKIPDEDEHKFLMHDLDDLMSVYHGVKKGVWKDSRGHETTPDAYNLQVYSSVKKEEKK